jgi:hypothetical protein
MIDTWHDNCNLLPMVLFVSQEMKIYASYLFQVQTSAKLRKQK